jgi:RNA polymerase sigma factor (sigma-70 family)
MYNQQVSWWRRRSRGREFSTNVVPDGAEQRDATADFDLRLSVAAALARLGPRQRAVLVLRYFDDLPESEVAELLGISVGTVRSTCHRAQAKLRALCPELAPYPNHTEASR